MYILNKYMYLVYMYIGIQVYRYTCIYGYTGIQVYRYTGYRYTSIQAGFNAF